MKKPGQEVLPGELVESASCQADLVQSPGEPVAVVVVVVLKAIERIIASLFYS